jgi:hypothetical protein
MSVPEGPRLEVGPALADGQSRWTLRLSEAAALNNDGSHFESEGVSSGGASVPVPLHRHEVEVDTYRTVVDLEYLSASGVAFRFKLPYEVRVRSASVVLVDPATADEQAAMQRGLDLHHPDGTLSGVRDLELTSARAWRSVLAQDDRLEFAGGLTLPTGETESNPYAEDAAGNLLPHEHMQFGSGTVDPLLQLTWSRFLTPDWSGNAYAAARVPLYENHHGFRAPRELTLSGGLGRALGDGWHLRGSLTALYSSQAEWYGVPDINTGWVATYAGVGAEWHGAAVSCSLLAQLPLAQNTIGEGDETFELGPVISLTVGGGF